jgi:autotransporter-associated beta strand protein
VAGGSYADLGGYLNSGVGAQSYIKFTTAPTLTGGILPYAVVGSDFGNILAFADYGEFATYDATRGVVAFSRTGTYVTSINGATAGDNVQVTTDGETWTGTRTMNSLNLRHTFAGTFSGGTLTLQSGGLITRNVYGQTQLGALNFNNQEAFVFHSGGHQLQLYGALSGIGANGINFTAAPMHSGGQADTPFIHLYNIGDNSITAPTRILMGTVLLGSGDPLGVSAVTVRQGATLSLPSSATRTLGSLAGAGTVRLSQSEGGTAAGSTLVVGGDNSSTTFSGEIHAGQWYYGRLDNGVLANPGVSGGNLVKTGTGTLTLTGMSTYNGTTTVRQGTLVAGGDVKSTLVYGGGLDTVPSLGSISGNALSGSLANGDRVILQTRYGDVSGWTPGQIYYVVNASGSTFQIADTPGGTAKTISGSNVAWGKLDAAKLVSSAGGDTLTLPSGWSLAEGDVVVFSSVPNLSALVAGIPYHVVDVSGSNFKVSAYAGGAPVRNLPSGSFGVVLPGVLGTGTNAIQVGDASTGSNPVGLLIGGPYTIARDVMVNNFGTGTTLGGNSSGAAAFTGTVTLNKDVNFTAAAGGTVTVSSGIAGTGGVTKIGDGKLQLEAGFLAAGGAVTVSQGTLGIADGVSLGRDVVVNNGARLAPGNSPGVVTVPSLTFDAGAIHQWEIDGVTNDVVNVTGTLDFNFSTPQTMTLELGWLAGGPSIQTNDVFKVFTYGTITGWDVAFGPANPSALFTFTDISGALNVSNAYVWADAANNGTVYLSGVSFVPEPSTLLLLGVGGLLVYRARRAVKLNKQ